jgi:hypothetical protein
MTFKTSNDVKPLTFCGFPVGDSTTVLDLTPLSRSPDAVTTNSFQFCFFQKIKTTFWKCTNEGFAYTSGNWKEFLKTKIMQ